ncbi:MULTISPECIES: pectate lyase [unclassified Fibrobacter]|uniref:pectate lyase family protein n=1 Tax=unclassified Fibrobacter TaxID=2634177 RepID=UPI00091A64C4|nr:MULTISPECIES: pectate lyase [unclassified Fibrobacter]SHK36798.1 Pectate lyase [Fibrobacter sp. UWB12]SIN90247.1 Pectate lyase [Fibrobacter sp. UWB11]
MKQIVSIFACAGFFAVANAQVSLQIASGALESAYAEWASDGSDSYNVYYSGAGASDVKVDAPLIRKYGSKFRVDVVGLKAGSYTLKVASVKGGKETASTTSKSLEVKAHDRAGFAFSNGHVPGAYNADGTLKSGAVVLYISESTKNTVKLDVVTSNKGAVTESVGLQNILTSFKKGYDKRPLVIRLLGNVTDPEVTDKGDITIDMGKKEGLSMTVEGIGNDATANGWGFRVKGTQDLEIRNIGIMNVDSDEGDNITLQQDNQYIWVHNNDFFYGHAGSDKDQVKGDGALDCKLSTYVTFSYNHFWDNGKSNLLGLKEGANGGYYITYHHNWYDHSDSRHPRVRYYSAHVYNNYYDGNAKYGAGSTLGSSVFMEANYFRNCKYPMMTSLQGTDVYASGTKRDPTNNGTFSKEAGGTIKAYNNHMEGSYTFIPYGASKYILKGKETAIGDIDSKVDFDAYVVSSREAQVPSSVKSYDGANTYNNFDTDKSIMYSYTADSPEQAVANVRAYAGRLQGGDFKWTFDNSVDDASSDVNQALKDALMAYKGSNGEVMEYSSSSSVIQSSSSSNVILSSSSEGSSNSSSSNVILSSSSEESSDSSSNEKVESSSSEGTMGFAKVMMTKPREIYYDARSASLVIGAADITRLDIIGVDGRRVNITDIKSVGDARVLDMSSLRAGVYIVRFLTPLGLQTMKFVKN